MKNYGDITKINGSDVEITDVVIGGSPCQDLSIAGLRKGLEGERSGLFMEQIRLIKEMRNECRKQLSSNESDGSPKVRSTSVTASPLLLCRRCAIWIWLSTRICGMSSS